MAKRIGKFAGVSKRQSALSLVDGGEIGGDLTVAGASTFNGTVTPGSGGIMAATPVVLSAADGSHELTLAANGGRTNIIPDMTGNSGIYDLPTPTAAGQYFHFVYGGSSADTHNLEIQTTTTDGSVYFVGSISFLDTTADDNSVAVFADGNSNDVLELNVLEACDLHFLSKSTTEWYVWGTVTSATEPAFADS